MVPSTPEAIYEDIYNVHASTIRSGDVRRSVLIVFSAIPGSGKSELTKRLVAEYGFTGLANKDIREAIKQTGHTGNVNIGDYTLWLLDKLVLQGSRGIVFDRNIDQWYEPIKSWAKHSRYKIVIVRIEISRATLEKRLHKREGSKVSHVLSTLDFYEDQHDQIKPAIQADVILNEDYNLDEAAHLIAMITD